MAYTTGMLKSGYDREDMILRKNTITHRSGRCLFMQVQYVYDENGEKTSVIVPIALWETVSRQKEAKKPKAAFDPAKFRGMYRSLAVNLEKELQVLRQEWERV
jgi:hypothetical protein